MARTMIYSWGVRVVENNLENLSLWVAVHLWWEGRGRKVEAQKKCCMCCWAGIIAVATKYLKKIHGFSAPWSLDISSSRKNGKTCFLQQRIGFNVFFCDKALLVKTWMLIKKMTMKIMFWRQLRPWKQAKSGHCHVPPLSLMPVRTSALYRCTAI